MRTEKRRAVMMVDTVEMEETGRKQENKCAKRGKDGGDNAKGTQRRIHIF